MKASITATKSPTAKGPSHQCMSETKQTILFVQLAIQPGGHLAIVCNTLEHTRSEYFVKQGSVMPSQPRGSPGSGNHIFFLVQTTTIAPVGNTGRPIECKKTHSVIHTAFAFPIWIASPSLYTECIVDVIASAAQDSKHG